MNSKLRMNEEQEDEMAMLEAMSKKYSEFQWEVMDNRVEGVLRIDLELPKEGLAIKLDPHSGIYNSKGKCLSLDVVTTVMHLPPIKLHFQLSQRYPLEEPPSFSLSCSWLNFSQVS